MVGCGLLLVANWIPLSLIHLTFPPGLPPIPNPQNSITIALPRLSRMVKSTRTLIKLPVLEIYVKPAEAGETEETVYQFGTMTYASEVIAAIEEQLKVHRKTE